MKRFNETKFQQAMREVTAMHTGKPTLQTKNPGKSILPDRNTYPLPPAKVQAYADTNGRPPQR